MHTLGINTAMFGSAATLHPEFSLASRPARSLGWQVRLVGWSPGSFFICLAGRSDG